MRSGCRYESSNWATHSRALAFIRYWFDQFDRLPKDDSFFVRHLSKDVNWQMPEGRFSGHAGFRDWCSLNRKTIKPGAEHRVSEFRLERTGGDDHQARFRVHLLGNNQAGNPVDRQVDETWTMTIDDAGVPLIYSYQASVA